MNLTVTFADSDVVVAIEVSPEMAVADLRAYTLAEAGFPPDFSSTVLHNDRMLPDTATLQAAGLADDDMVMMTRPEPPVTEQSEVASAPNARAPAHSTVNPPTPARASTTEQSGDRAFRQQIEQARQQILYDPQLLVQLSNQSPELAEALHDPEDFRRAYLQLRQQQLRNSAESDEIDRNFQLAMQEMPEAFTTVTMLFANVEVNGVPVKAFVDSGAQTTIMSPSCAERCQLSHLIDKRHRGMAYGVGQATILGRIHMAPIKIGRSYFACSMTVIEGTNIEFLLGLDMLRHHQAVIDLRRNTLRMGNEDLPFLPESEVPKGLAGPPVPAGPVVIGKSAHAPQGAVPKREESGLPADPLTTLASKPASQPAPQATPQLTTQPMAQAGSNTVSPEVSNLMGLGFSERAVVSALERANGDPDLAAAILFGE